MDSLEKKHLDTSRGFRYRYYISSASQADNSKPALLLCHGFPDGADLYQFIVPHLLRSRMRIVVPDLLGYGGTSKPTDPQSYEIRGMVNDVMEIIKAEKIEQEIMPLGHDWGSYLAQRFYLLNTNRCAGLITLCVALMVPFAAPFNLEEVNKSTKEALGYPLYEYWNLFLPHEGAKLMESRLESCWYVMHGDQKDWMYKMFCVPGAMRKCLEDDLREPLKPYAQDGKLRDDWIAGKKEGGLVAPTCWYRAIAYNHNLEAEKTLDARIEKPYLFIGADGDAVCRTGFIEVSKGQGLLADVEVHELNASHWCPYEKPDEIGKITLEWLEKKGFSAK